MASFEKINFADAEITNIVFSIDNLIIEYKDWKEKTNRLTFSDVIAIKIFSPFGEDLSHGKVEAKSSFMDEAGKVTEESPDDYLIYSLFSAWSGKSIVSVVANSYHVSNVE